MKQRQTEQQHYQKRWNTSWTNFVGLVDVLQRPVRVCVELRRGLVQQLRLLSHTDSGTAVTVWHPGCDTKGCMAARIGGPRTRKVPNVQFCSKSPVAFRKWPHCRWSCKSLRMPFVAFVYLLSLQKEDKIIKTWNTTLHWAQSRLYYGAYCSGGPPPLTKGTHANLILEKRESGREHDKRSKITGCALLGRT